ncbi:hypothetical protein EUAN_07250 [Andreesenia angusta]|uniref:Uncharacterized protein n=1 Tax=Andreesenia angusta TaxID=39480 RepID=A0A1S1V8J5_9FIRM|nr:hypothetical protein [Andreesenia angusta]OHW62941.1 hypothetical protein EUAN_07250 [Andreesenia angusta]
MGERVNVPTSQEELERQEVYIKAVKEINEKAGRKKLCYIETYGCPVVS